MLIISKCRKFTGEVRPHDRQPVEPVGIGNDSLEVVNKFFHLDVVISAGGSVEAL